MKNPTSDIDAAVKAGAASVEIGKRFQIEELAPNRRIALTVSGDAVTVPAAVQRALDELAPGPTHRSGLARLHELDSFIEHVNRNKDGVRTTLWADAREFLVRAVYDDDPSGPEFTDAGYRQFRAVYECPKSEPWCAWTAVDGVAMSQTDFADFLEDRLDDIVVPESDPDSPPASALLEVARNLIINSTGRFKRTVDPSTGTGSLICETDHDKSSTRIPRFFHVGIPVFEQGVVYSIRMLVRFKLIGGHTPQFTLQMQNRARAESDAFGDVRTAIAESTDLVVLAGEPAANQGRQAPEQSPTAKERPF